MVAKNKNKKGFTLIELIIVIAIIAILFATVVIFLDPGRRMSESRNSARWITTKALADAITVMSVDDPNTAKVINEMIEGPLKMIGEDFDGCTYSCGEAEVANYNGLSEVQNVDLKVKSIKNWFNISDIYDLNYIKIKLAVSCTGNCDGDINIRLGNDEDQKDYRLISGSKLSYLSQKEEGMFWVEGKITTGKSSLKNEFYLQILPYEGMGNVQIFKDTDGTKSPKVEYYSVKQDKWILENGDYYIKLFIEEKTEPRCLNLQEPLDTYFEIPIDPAEDKDGTISFFGLKRNLNGNLVVKACSAELDEQIRITR